MIGLLGKSLGYSLSKPLHQQLGSTAYQLFETTDLDAFMKQTPFKALNVTHPYKAEIVRYCTTRDPIVEAIGVANTVIWQRNGTLHAANTDYAALAYLIACHGPKDRDAEVAIIGNGATAKTARHALENAGYANVHMYARQPRFDERPFSRLADVHNASALIQATPVGTAPNLDEGFDLNLKDSQLKWVFDVVYNPPTTKLVQAAKKAGIKAHGGLAMLVLQALYAHGLFYDTPPPLERFESVYKALLKTLINVILIGPSFAGKSATAPKLAERLGKKAVDIDALIEAKSGMRISDIFTRLGEHTFRSMEKYQTRSVAQTSGQVIATGGGIVLQDDVMETLRQTGPTVFINPDSVLMKHAPFNNRPLLQSWADYQAMRTERDPLYHAYADLTLNKTSLDFDANLHAIEEELDAYLSRQWAELECAR